jgi:hypothetical protein
LPSWLLFRIITGPEVRGALGATAAVVPLLTSQVVQQVGYPSIDGDVIKALELYQKHVFVLLNMYLLIDPHREKKSFAQQSLYAFLKMLNKIPDDIC